MTDQTPDPWDYLAEFIEGNAVRPPGGQQVGPPRYPLVPSVAKELRGIVEAGKRALAAERAQHQQELERIEGEYEALGRLVQSFEAGEAQRDETIRQLQAEVQRQKDLVLAQTRLGSEAFERAHAAEAQIATLTQELSVSRANHIDANQRNMQSVRELEAAEARCATLTAALKALYEVFDCESVAEGCEFGYQTCSAISEARAALSGVPAPESKPK